MLLKKLFVLLMILSTLVYAKQHDKFKISLGGMFVTDYETEMQLSRSGGFLQARLNTKDQLNMDTKNKVFRLDGYYRFTPKHGLDFSIFSARSSGAREATNLPWDSQKLTGYIKSHFNMDVYKVDYAYSFYRNKDVELALSAGLHITTVDFGIELGAKGSLVDGKPIANPYTEGASVTAPLPVVGFKGCYHINKNWFVDYKADYLYLKLDIDGTYYDGSLISTQLNLEYSFMENYGVGVGYNSNEIQLKVDDDVKRIDFVNTLSGVLLYLSYTY